MTDTPAIIPSSRLRIGLLIGLLFFVSGFTGLLYEVVWAKYLALLLGSTAYAQLGVLAVFMGGIASGSVVWGKMADRIDRPLLLYGVLEVGIGIGAAALALAFDPLSRVYWSALAVVGTAGIGAVALKMAACVSAMFPPTFCMGGTLPVLSRALGLTRTGLGRGVAYLYAVNSFGAALGAVVTAFLLIATWGYDRPFLGAAAVNAAVGAIAMLVALRLGPLPDAQAEPALNRQAQHSAIVTEPAREARFGDRYGTVVLAGAAVSGAVAMVYEVAWIRLCSLVLGSSTYSFAIMLSAFIIGIGAGSLLYAVTTFGRRRPLRFFAHTSIAASATLLICMLGFDRLPYFMGRLTAILRQHNASFAAYQAATLLICLLVMLPLTFISGLNFPALAHAAGHARRGIAGPVSHVLFANTAGAIVGAVLGGLYVLPVIGLRGTFLFAASAAVAMAMIVFAGDRDLTVKGLVVRLSGCVFSLVAYVYAAPPWDPRLLTAGEFRSHSGVEASFGDYRAGMQREILFYRDGVNATVSVERQPPDEVMLRINGKTDASAQGDRDTQLLVAHLPAVLHPGAHHTLVIGYGSGMTVGALLQHPMESIDVVEISPEVIAADAYFRELNRNPLHDRRTHLIVEDARTFLYRTSEHYDLIISEPSNPWVAGIGNLFTEEFFQQARDRLAPDGMLVQWVHSYEISDQLVALILRTVAHQFDEVRVFQLNAGDIVVAASPQRRTFNRNLMDQAFQYAADLRPSGITRLTTLLALEALPDAAVRRIAGSGAMNTDRMPRLEYGAPRAFFDARTSSLVADASSDDDVGFIQAAADLSSAEQREIAAYAQHANTEYDNRRVRFLAAWLPRTPTDAVAIESLRRWISMHPNSSQILSTLVRAVPVSDPVTRPDYVRLLLRIVRTLHLRPAPHDVATVAPAVRAVAQQSGDVGLLKHLGDLYADAGAYGEALVTFEAALAQADAHAPADGAVSRAALHCARGHVLEKMGDTTAARQAFQSCMELDADNAEAPAGLRRLDSEATPH